MTDLVEQITVATEGVTVSKLVWRRFRRQTTGLVERILSHPANRGLADQGRYLTVGTVVTVPIDTPRKNEERTTVRLW